MSIRYQDGFGDVDDSTLKKSIPKFIEDHVEFQRDEKFGFISIRSNKLPRLQELFFNPTAVEVIKECDGKTSVFSIIDKMRRKYGLDYNDIKRDILEILFIFNRFQFIKWVDGGNDMQNKVIAKSDGLTVEVLDESEIRALISFLKLHKNDIKYIHLMSNYKVYLEELYLREALFSYSEDFYVMKNGNDISSIISIKYNKNTKSTVASIGIMCGNINELEFILDAIQTLSNDISEFKVNKLKIQFIKGNVDKNILEFLNRKNFNLEFTAKAELDGKDIEHYSYFFNDGEGDI